MTVVVLQDMCSLVAVASRDRYSVMVVVFQDRCSLIAVASRDRCSAMVVVFQDRCSLIAVASRDRCSVMVVVFQDRCSLTAVASRHICSVFVSRQNVCLLKRERQRCSMMERKAVNCECRWLNMVEYIDNILASRMFVSFGERTESHVVKHANSLGFVKSNKLPLLCTRHIYSNECLHMTIQMPVPFEMCSMADKESSGYLPEAMNSVSMVITLYIVYLCHLSRESSAIIHCHS